MKGDDQGGQGTRVTLALRGRFGDYPCSLMATIGATFDVSGEVDVEAARLGDFLKKTLPRPGSEAPPSSDGAIAELFPGLSLPQKLKVSYRSENAELLLQVSDLKIKLGDGWPIPELDFDFAFGRLSDKAGVEAPQGDSQYIVGVRALSRTRIELAKIVGGNASKGGGGSDIIGKLLGDLGISHLGVFYASADIRAVTLFDAEEADFAQGPSFTARFGTKNSFVDIALPPVADGQGASGVAQSGGGTARPLASPGAGTPATHPDTSTMVVSAGGSRMRKWLKVQKTFGPLELRRIGGEWHDGKLGFLLDAGVELLGLKVALAGLRVSVAPAKLANLKFEDLEFGLDGLEIGFKSGPISISGAFLKTPDGAYSGMAVIRASMFTIAAIGSYATTVKGDPSLYIFGAYVGVIGGPPCFVVQGIAAGFGYNRGLTVPEIEKVRNFPLVSLVMSPAPSGSTNMLEQLGGDDFPVKEGQYWLAAGIKFTSFKLIDAFALLTVQFGARFELALLGVATMQQPPKVEGTGELVKPFVFVELALSVRFAPDDGLLAVRAALTSNSYLFDIRCKLTGGFAFCIWFHPTNPAFKDHAGDFVLTFGGYHPRFKVPLHYPQVPRVGFNWQLPNQGVAIKGECYFALTPSCIMGGCRLLATYHSSVLQVWFEAHADFLMAWEPFHYEAEIGIWIGASFTLCIGEITVTISFQLGASLSIWGPEFAGEAHIDLGIASFTVPIGAANQPRTVPPLKWTDFSGKFIPRIDKKPAPLGIAIAGGLLREDKDKGTSIVNPCELSLIVDAYIPVSSLRIGQEELSQEGGAKRPFATQFGIRPMGETAIDSRLDIKFLGPDRKPAPMRSQALTKGVPEALWSQEPAPSASGTQQIEAKVIGNALSGVRLSVGEMRQPEEAITSLTVDPVAKRTARPRTKAPIHAPPVDFKTARERLHEKLVGNAEGRKQTVMALQSLGFDLSAEAIDLEKMARYVVQADVLLAPPAFVALGQLPPQRQDQ